MNNGDRVMYDDNPGTIREQVDRPGPVSYEVEWDNGHVSTVWGSDLLPAR